MIPPVALKAFQMANELELSLLKVNAPAIQNISKAERQAMEELKNNKEIIIKPADTGSAVVVMVMTTHRRAYASSEMRISTYPRANV